MQGLRSVSRSLRGHGLVALLSMPPCRTAGAAAAAAPQALALLGARNRRRVATGFSASAQEPPADARSETALGLLHLLEEKGQRVDAATGDSADGRVLSSAAGLIRTALPGPVATGCEVQFGAAGSGLVLRYDRRGAVVAAVARGVQPRVGDSATLGEQLVVRLPQRQPESSGLRMLTPADLLCPAIATEGGTPPLRPVPIPAPFRRRPIRRRLANGLVATEALLPLAEGHRVGFVGPPTTGKSTAARLILKAQAEGTACVYAAQRPAAQLQAFFGSMQEADLTVIHADPAMDTAAARYLVPGCAIQVATQLQKKHHHVVVVLDDLSAFAAAAAELGSVAPASASHLASAALDAAGVVDRGDGKEQALTVIAIVDADMEEELPPLVRGLWRGVEPSFDVCLSFSTKHAADGIMPAIDVDELLTAGFSPPYQPPLLRHLRAELIASLRASRDLREKLFMGKQLGLHAEMDEEEDFGSSKVARALLSQGANESIPLSDLAVIIAASLVYRFPRQRQPPSMVTAFRKAIVETVREEHPALWATLCELECLDHVQAAGAIQNLGEVLLQHRLDFRLTRPEPF